MDQLMGTIMLWPLNWAPQGWFFCNGQLLNISQYQALFALIGTTYGGNGTTTFALPDFRGYVPVGYNMNGTPPSAPNLSLGQVGGEANHTLSLNEMPTHTHIGALSGGAGTVKVSSANASQAAATAGASIATPGTSSGRSFNSTLGFNTTAPDTALNNASIGSLTGTVTNQVAGASMPHNNMQPYLAVSFIIAWEGVFPTRP